MKEKTLRYPGHIEKMEVLRETGFFSKEPVKIGGSEIRPIDFTAKLLFPMWELKKGDVDITLMKIAVEGKKDDRDVRYIYNLFDRYDEVTGIHSMARVTGYTATVAVRMIAVGLYDREGVSPPEYMGKSPKCVDFMLKGLKKRGVVYEENIEILK
jgi:saccharopine dehydrogenase-like NADP-dependent oxidoreductase